MELLVVSIHPRDIRRDDQWISPADGRTVWTAIEDAGTRTDETIRCTVKFTDGELGERVWSALDPTLKIVVKRRI